MLKRFSLQVVVLAICAVLCLLPNAGCDLRKNVDQRYKQVVQQREQRDATVWREEQLAIAHERTVITLWDRLRRAGPGQYAQVLQAFPIADHVSLQQPANWTQADHGMERLEWQTDAWQWNWKEFVSVVHRWQRLGFRLVQSEWHHERFQPATQGAAHSIVSMNLHVLRSRDNKADLRYEIQGQLEVTWNVLKDQPFFVAQQVCITRPSVVRRAGPPDFVSTFRASMGPIVTTETCNDVVAYDLDGDGRSEILYHATNQLLVNDGQGGFTARELFAVPPTNSMELCVVDITGDRRADAVLTCFDTARDPPAWRLLCYEQQTDGSFSKPPRTWHVEHATWRSPDSLTIADIDGDHDLDVFVTQYMAPAVEGRMPEPYFDANDGYPCMLLVNDGQGTFRDLTRERGLGKKRHRRAYRSSWMDLDRDADVDLVVVSDFSGVDVFENDGQGMFRDRTDAWIDRRENFGMSHSFADFNGDGLLDMVVTGMASTTARRLAQLGLGRSEYPRHQQMRLPMAYGNRLYFGRNPAGFEHRAASAEVARGGWSWGCASFDVENDGDMDLYVANGHVSGASVADYCTRFWCHDIYTPDDQVDTDVFTRLVQTNGAVLGSQISWNGYEKNRMFLNRAGQGFDQAAFLLGVAIEQDSRPVIADDFDGDGRVDLLVGWCDRSSKPPQFVLEVFQNRSQTNHHWIAFRPVDVPASQVLGACATVTTDQGVQSGVIVTGDSFAAQHAPVWHFGLGTVSAVRQVEIVWTGGDFTRLVQPAVDTVHDVRVSAGN